MRALSRCSRATPDVPSRSPITSPTSVPTSCRHAIKMPKESTTNLLTTLALNDIGGKKRYSLPASRIASSSTPNSSKTIASKPFEGISPWREACRQPIQVQILPAKSHRQQRQSPQHRSMESFRPCSTCEPYLTFSSADRHPRGPITAPAAPSSFHPTVYWPLPPFSNLFIAYNDIPQTFSSGPPNPPFPGAHTQTPHPPRHLSVGFLPRHIYVLAETHGACIITRNPDPIASTTRIIPPLNLIFNSISCVYSYRVIDLFLMYDFLAVGGIM